MTKAFKKALAVARRSDVPERLQLFGDMPDLTPSTALPLDWLHVIEVAKTDALEAMRMMTPDQARAARRGLRRNLAIIVVACLEWEKRI